MKSPIVSICCITYNHEQFIAQALDGFVMQQTNFDFEIVISNDCSTDNTQFIIDSYKSKYPYLFKDISPKENQGMSKNFIYTLKNCNGKYVALCEGDDYWTDPLKLQKQVDFLEKNLEYSICFHPIHILLDDKQQIVDDFITKEVHNTTDVYDLIQGNYIHTGSVMYRNTRDALQELLNVPFVMDFVSHLIFAKYGKIKKLSEKMSVYRFGVGIWSKNDGDNKRILYSILVNDSLYSLFDGELKQIIIINIKSSILHIFSTDFYRKNKEYIEIFFQNNRIRNYHIFFDIINEYVSNQNKLRNYDKLLYENEILKKSYSYRVVSLLLLPFSLLKKLIRKFTK